jgi:arylformamidase
MAADVPAWLAARGVKLVGFDVPSVDLIDSKDLPIHHACDAAKIVILENLDLRVIAPGVYELIALPLRIKGGDGSPLRAVLRSGD